jgi:maltooligosyltrehalose synthase
MDKPKGLADRIETWMRKIPGVRTYMEREHRRETDKKLREHLASRLQESRSQLKKITLDLSVKNQMESLAKLDRFSSRLQQMADTIRYASYGYSGIFDLEKIREDELDRLYSLEEVGQASSPYAREKKVEEAEAFLDVFETQFNRRKELIMTPPPSPGT